ncbi:MULTISPECIES: N-formylglutamate amidohydrolase [Sphingomonadales]|uniref:N-formylglutamate amidohydrolase n=2 Tax=Edaphosphingomonas TaxID=3423724 RepID=A0A2T4HYJ1_9SPHN|nr:MULTISPECIES: N-formylglutamate amidohydrolase [Sphingomonas]AGH50989.1 N-formylglutamate amidohydrolase [Sphingomonas sp. MM-1]MDX3885269.1 N-formylglutamate amidohydrolase [Sphingomonas sp.]OHT19543.1 N-formylglutamate amidohydrolase [Sphingomonas haloaromaticamans]PTD21153.1 N-formylglutamate amidohydrolase [Sphingomonas fennica]
MSEAWIDIPGNPASRLLLIGDHASNRVPADIDLGIDPALLNEHVAIDIGVDPLGRALCAALDCPGILGGVSRLVTDLNREEDKPGLVPIASDGHAVPGNALDHAGREARIARFWRPYHARVAELIASGLPAMLISLHSFTPKLATSDEPRPWSIGILYNEDDRAARIAIPLLEAAGVATGDNQPYSGKVLNATMNLHGEGSGIPYLGIEVRQDLIGDEAGVARWAGILAPVIRATADALIG